MIRAEWDKIHQDMSDFKVDSIVQKHLEKMSAMTREDAKKYLAVQTEKTMRKAGKTQYEINKQLKELDQL